MDFERSGLSQDLTAAAHALIESSGLDGPHRLEALPGGSNNRIYRVVGRRSSLALKAYYQDPDFPRRRVETEYQFLKYAYSAGLRCVPEPVACDPEHGLALYIYMEGRPVSTGDVTGDRVREILEFYQGLNRPEAGPMARSLPPARDSGFSMEDHVRFLERRLARLEQIEGPDPVDRDAIEFVRLVLLPIGVQIVSSARESCVRLGLSPAASIPPEDRRLSPSDFGFHNALIRQSGRLCFLDFEYAGWDDPAKTVADLFGHPDLPVPEEYYEDFSKSVAADLSDPEFHRTRMDILLPVCRLKWCCILLNDFSPELKLRREFAASDDRRSARLARARQILAQMTVETRAEI